MGNQERLVFSLEEWAGLMGCSIASAYNWARQGRVQGLIRLGERRYCVSKAVTLKLLETGTLKDGQNV